MPIPSTRLRVARWWLLLLGVDGRTRTGKGPRRATPSPNQRRIRESRSLEGRVLEEVWQRRRREEGQESQGQWCRGKDKG
ncbi:hypothetical protein LX36DRAFT_652564 [Colletotrichum falcatum]|nr:hypothetical protein LX36DRAFT_652564 [Colletotrichum falcatum]